MLNVIFQGMMLGFGASVPIGPVNVLIISYALKSYKNAIALGLGSMSADVIYLFVMSFGYLKFLEQDFIKKILAIFGFIFLIIIAIMLFMNAKKKFKLHMQTKKTNAFLIYIKGLLITLLNPYTVGFWLSISTFVGLQKITDIKYLFFGLIFAILLWVLLMPYIVWKNKRFLSEKVVVYFSYTAGCILMFFAFVLVYNIFILERL